MGRRDLQKRLLGAELLGVLNAGQEIRKVLDVIGTERRRSRARNSLLAYRTALSLASLFTLGLSTGWWNDIPPLGHDASGHIVLMSRVAEALATGAGWWAPDFNMGFPIGLYYQPLPHFAGGVIAFALGGGTAAIGVYKALTVGLLSATPWAVALGARRMGLPAIAACAAGCAAPLLASTLDFGLTTHSTLVLGLHSQAWAGVALPLALGEIARAIGGDRRALGTAAAGWGLLSLCHFFYGVALIAVTAVWVLCRPRDVLFRSARAALVGLATGLSLAFWLVPLFDALPAMGGWPFGSAVRVEGYGFGGFFRPLLDGHLLDGETGLPVLSALALVGLGACALEARRSCAARLVLSMLALSVFFSVGRAGLGGAVDVFPFNRFVQLFRYIGLFHLAGLWLIGWAVGGVWARMPRSRLAVVVACALACALLASPVKRAADQLRLGYKTIDTAGVDMDAYSALTEAIGRQTADYGAGRVFAFPRSGLHGHFYSALLALWNASDMGESMGVGLHDSLNYYFLEFFHPEDEVVPTQTELYGFQYVAAAADREFAHLHAEAVFRSDEYALWRRDDRVSICRPIHVGERLVGFPRDLRRRARAWLNGNGPAAGVHHLATLPAQRSLGGVTAGPVQVSERDDVREPAGPPGLLQMAQQAPDRAVCRVEMDQPGAVLFRVSYHPFWRATVDGRPAPLAYAFPAFIAVEVGQGEHEVVIRYRLPGYVHLLLALAPLPIALLWLVPANRGSSA